jgi:ligand-binding sensor domain-containing protein
MNTQYQKNKLKFLLYLLLLSLSVYSQPFKWVGLQRSPITCIKKEGNILWIGTTTGLIKFDIQTNIQTVFNPNNPHLTYGVSEILIDKNYTKWIITENNKILKLKNGKLESLPDIFNSPNLYSINSSALDKAGKLWIASNSGLYKFEGNQWINYSPDNSLIPETNISSIVIDMYDNKWIVAGSALCKYNNKNWNIYPTLPWFSNHTTRLIQDKRGEPVFINYINEGKQGIFTFNHNEWSLLMVDSQSIGRNITFDCFNNLCMISNDNSLLEFDGKNFMEYKDSVEKNYHFNGSFYIDENNTKWIGTREGVIIKYEKKTWTYLSVSNADLISSVASMKSDINNNKWTTNYYNNSLFIYDEKKWSTISPDSNSDSYSTYSHEWAIDKKNNIWIFGLNKIKKFDGKQWSSYEPTNFVVRSDSSYIDDEDGNEILILYTYNCFYSIIIDQQNNKWIGGYGTLYKYDDTNWRSYPIKISQSSDSINRQENNVRTEINFIAIDNHENKWMGTTHGLYKFSKDSVWTEYKQYNELNTNITSISIDKNNNKWILTDSGILKFDDKNLIKYDSSNTKILIGKEINGLAVDEFGVLWISANNTLIKYDGKIWSTIRSFDSEISILHIDIINHNIWIGVRGIGVAVFDNNSKRY